MTDVYQLTVEQRRQLPRTKYRVIGRFGPFNSKPGDVVELNEIDHATWRDEVVELGVEREQQAAQHAMSDRERAWRALDYSIDQRLEERRNQELERFRFAALREQTREGRRHARLRSLEKSTLNVDEQRERGTSAKKAFKEATRDITAAEQHIAELQRSLSEADRISQERHREHAREVEALEDARREEIRATTVQDVVRAKEKAGEGLVRVEAAALLLERSRDAYAEAMRLVDEAVSQRDNQVASRTHSVLKLATAELATTAHGLAAQVREKLAPLVVAHDEAVAAFVRNGDLNLLGEDHLIVREVHRVLLLALEGE